MSLFSKLSKNNEKNLYPWSQKKLNGSNSALPRAGHAAACISSDAMVIFGGIHKTNTKKELFYIDTNTLAATSINASGDAPNARISPTMVTINGHIMLYGGRPISPEEGYDNGFYILNLQHRQWTRVYLEGVQPVERWGHTAVVQDGIMYMFGGQKDGNYFNDLFVFNSSTFKSTPRWDMINYNNECPEPRSGHISAIYESKIYIFGGTNGHYLFNDLWSFDLHTGLWLRIDTEGFIPSPRESCAASIVDDIIYVIGGKGENGSELNDLCAYKIKSRRWFRFQNMGPSPSPRHGLTITTVRDKLYVLGGDNESSKMDDASTIYILDSTKIKYPADAPPPVDNNTAYQQQQQSQQYYESSPSEDPQYQQHYNQQQHQYQQQQVGGQVPSHQHQPAYSLQQQQQQQQQQQYQGQYSPQLQNFQAPYLQQNQHSPQQQQQRQQRQNTPTSPVQQQHHNIVSSDVETQHSPTNNSPISASPRHRSYYPDQNANQPPVRPPRHVSTVPEAALRRPRATSPLPNSETENTHDVRRQLHNGNNTHLNVDSERSSPSIMSITDDVKQQPSPVSPPPRPPREGIGLGNSQRNTVMVSSDRQQVEENLRPKSQMPIRNQSVPTSHEPRQVVGTTPSPINKQQQNEQVDQQQAELQQMKAQQQAELQQMKAQQKHTHESAAAATAAAVTAATAALEAAADEERQSMLREIESRDAIINEMKKKESWWRTEVSLARKQRNANGEHYDEGPDADESLLMDVDHLDEDKVKLFEQLVSVKAELRRVRASIFQQAQPMSDKVSQADRMRTAALQEAAYFKSKYLALKSRRQDELSKLDASRSEELEKRLAAALSENESSNKLLVQLQKQSQHDQMARQATEERAHEAQTRAEEAQQAHQRALEELQVVYTRATKAEIQVRDNAVKIADLTHQLSQALAVQPTVKSQEVTDAQLKASQLEAANLKARNETANLKQKLAEQLDDIARLRNLLQEREDQLTEAKIHLEDYEIQLGMLRESINQQQHATNGYASTKAY